MVAKGAKMPFIPRRPAEVRFEEKVQYDPNTGCWLWLGGPENGRRQKEKTHCPHGHSYADAYVNAQGHRACATCRRAKSLREAHNKRKNISQNSEVGA
jgi:hypothetical protein